MANDEDSRLDALYSYGVLDTSPAQSFDRIVKLAAALLEAPIALVSLIDKERQWFKAKVGLDACETPREWAFCGHAIRMEQRAVMVVEDATLDSRFQTNPLVLGGPKIRFYAGAVLTNAQGQNLGTLCVIDTRARPRPSVEQIEQLRLLAEIVVDELELLRAGAATAKANRLLNLAEHVSGVGNWRYHIKSGQVHWSDQMYRIHGLERDFESPTFELAMNFYAPAIKKAVAAKIRAAIATGTGFEFQATLTARGGSKREVVCKAECEKTSNGVVVAIVGVFQDITDHVEALRKAEHASSALRHLVEGIEDYAIYMLDIDGQVMTWNSGAERNKGYRADEIIGKNYSSFFTEQDRKSGVPQKQLATAIRFGRLRAEGWRVKKSGETFWAEVCITPLIDESEQLFGFAKVTHDLTTRKLHEGKLAEAKEAAEAATRAKSEFLANMSHEIRTPLTSVIGFADLLHEHEGLTGSAQSYVNRIRNGGRTLLDLINDILDFSKLEDRQIELWPVPTNVAELADQVVELLAGQAAKKGLVLDVLCTSSVRRTAMLVDPQRLRQVILNLVGNAIKFTDKGSVILELESHQPENSELPHILKCRVVDTGCGIPETRIGNLFQRFSQLDGSASKRHGGTGLGLAICKGLVEVMRGRIGVETQVGNGSTFWFVIPAPIAEKTEAVTPVSLRVAFGIRKRILIVDDNDFNLTLVTAALDALGVEMVVAKSGEEALDLAKATAFDLILMDVRMPGMGGTAAMQAIRGARREAICPVVAFTAEGDRAQLAKLLSAGFDSTISKPVDILELRACISRLLSPLAA